MERGEDSSEGAKIRSKDFHKEAKDWTFGRIF